VLSTNRGRVYSLDCAAERNTEQHVASLSRTRLSSFCVFCFRYSYSFFELLTATESLILGFLDIFRVRGLVLGDKVLARIPGQPACELGNFLPQTVDRLLIHVCLGDKLRQRD
jgi:hypothetical protein